MAARVIHNFSGRRAVIVATAGGAVEVLESTLRKLGLSVERAAASEAGVAFDFTGLQADQDILFLDGESNGLVAGAAVRAIAVPVIGLVGVEAPSRLKAFVNLGATAFIRKPIHGGAVYSALFLGVNQFLHRRDLELQIEEHQNRRRRRRVVVKAIVMLMRHAGINDDSAYAKLREYSMRRRLTLEDYCEEFLAGCETDSKPVEPRILAQ